MTTTAPVVTEELEKEKTNMAADPKLDPKQKYRKRPREYIIDHDRKQRLPNGNVVDWNRGMIAQIPDIVGDCYHEWINHPKLGRLRMYDDNFVESFSFTPWWVVPCMYIPWAILEYREAIIREDSVLKGSWFAAALVWIFGIFCWTWFEYVAHRFAFHWEPQSNENNVYHFMGHGMHHITPADEFRLVFPPILSTPPAMFWRFLCYSLLPPGLCAAVYGGTIFGYACYESTHFMTHHNPIGSYFENRFYWHSKHHFDPAKRDAIFGVSSQLWDAIYGTL